MALERQVADADVSFSLPVTPVGTFFEDGFESGDLTNANGGFFWKVPNPFVQVNTDQPKTGLYSTRFQFQGSASGGDARAELPFGFGAYYSEIWISYDLYIPSNYFHRDEPAPLVDNNKAFCALWAGTYDGANREGPLLLTEFRPTGTGGSVLDFKVFSRINGVGQNVGSYGFSQNGIRATDIGQWMKIIIHAKYATEDDWTLQTGGDETVAYTQGDGIYELWKTDWQGVTEKLINVQDGPFYATQPNTLIPARGFDSGYLLGAANSGFTDTTNLYIDNFTVSTDSLL